MHATIARKSAPAAPASAASRPASKTVAHVAIPFSVKASDDGARSITGLAAAWTLDAGRDVILKGAFARTLGRWRQAKDSRPIQLIDQHSYRSIGNVIGKLTEATETEAGLETTFEFVPDDPAADAAYKRVKGNFVTGLSIGYEPVKWTYEKVEGGEPWDQIRILEEVKLLEVSLVIWPMNDDARVAGVKRLFDAVEHGDLTPEQTARLTALLAAKKRARFAAGDRVVALAEHMEGMRGSAGKVSIVENGPYYGVTFDGERRVHKWLAEDELKPAPAEDDDDDRGGGMEGMSRPARALPGAPPAPAAKGAPAAPAPAHDALAEAARDELLRALTLGSLGAPAL